MTPLLHSATSQREEEQGSAAVEICFYDAIKPQIVCFTLESAKEDPWATILN